MDYSKTLNLPKTKFPMRGNLPKKEPETVEFWEQQDIYGKTLDKNQGLPKFILHDGPPYANGDIHLGHTLNKVLKDIVVKFKSMSGYDAPYIPGWDTHGLPIELQAIKHLKVNRDEISSVEFRKMCRNFAMKYMKNQREQFKRLGVRGDWENPYLTLKPQFEAKQIEIFGDMANKGYIYKGLKPVYWCPDCATALAEAEIEYADHKTDSIYVKFRVRDDKGLIAPLVDDLSKVYFVIWTTTTWTLPANLAICLGPEFEYCLFKAGEEYYITARELAGDIAEVAGSQDFAEIATFDGTQLEGMTAQHPFMDRESLVILGDHVTLDQGTGCVHTAPGHGQEDFDIGREYNLDVLNPVNDRGYMTDQAGKYEGLYYEDSNEAILKDLRATGALLGVSKITHSYPHCWRCKSPVIFRATEQWFASVEGFRDKALAAVRQVEWIPGWGQDRITNMIQDRQDWCISRQRIWGVPIPIFYCEECGKELINDDTISAVAKLFGEQGSDVWYEMEAEEILPEHVKCPCGGRKFRKETDIMDVWFDSGSSHAAVLETTPGQVWPADLYLEGSDQHRGWFQSSLLTSVATRGSAPYKAVLTHGFVVDGEGKKMSKSLGNGIDPMEVIEQYGADILRLWVVSADYRTDVRISKDILRQLSEIYRKIRNTARFLLGNLYDFDPAQHRVEYDDMEELDRWALMKLQGLIDRVLKAYKDYEYHIIYHSIHNFCVVDMSNFYLDIIKDRLYTFKADSKERRSAQTAMYDIISSLVRLITPILAFTAEEIWKYMPEGADGPISPQLTDMPKANPRYMDQALEKKWSRIIDVRMDVSKALENARAEKVIGNSLNAMVKIYTQGEWYSFLEGIKEDLPTIFIASKVEIIRGEGPKGEQALVGEQVPDISIMIDRAPGIKCERCWTHSETVGQDSQHEDICIRCVGNLS